MQEFRERKVKQSGRGSYLTTTRRNFMRGAAVVAGSAALPVVTRRRAQAATSIKYVVTTGIHEMAQFVIPDFLPPEYEIDFISFGTSGISMLAAMLQGQAEVVSSANSYLISSRAQGAKITAICGIAGRGQAIVARTDRGIKRLDDLRGKKLVTKRYTSSHAMLLIVLRALGIDPNKDVEFVYAGEPAGFTVLLQRGDVDAGQLWEPHVSIAASDPKIVKLELDRFFELTWPTHSSTAVTQKTIDERPEMVHALVDGTVKAVERLKNDRDRWLKIAQKYVGQSPEIIRAAMDNSDPRTDLDMTMLYRNAEVMLELGIVKKDVAREMEEAVDYSFLERITGKSKESLGFVSYADYKQGKRYTPG